MLSASILEWITAGLIWVEVAVLLGLANHQTARFARAQMLLGVAIIGLICSQLLIIAVTFMKVFVLVGQLLLLPTFWQALKEFEK